MQDPQKAAAVSEGKGAQTVQNALWNRGENPRENYPARQKLYTSREDLENCILKNVHRQTKKHYVLGNIFRSIILQNFDI